MGKKTVLFKSKEKMDVQSVSEFLHAFADKLAEGQIVLRQGTQEIEISVANTVAFELEVEEKPKKSGTQQSLEIELSWYMDDNKHGPVVLG